MNKLWNAARFGLMNLEDFTPAPPQGALPVDEAQLSTVDRWILHRLNQVTAEAQDALENYRFNDYAQTIYHFVWHELCDWYIEFIKPALYNDGGDGDAERRAAQATLNYALETSLRLLHPATPFITEDIWQALPKPDGAADSIMVAEWPKFDGSIDFSEECTTVDLLIALITQIRAIRGETNVKPSVEIETMYLVAGDNEQALITKGFAYIQRLAKVAEIKFVTRDEAQAMDSTATAIVDGIEIRIPLKGLIDVDEEVARLKKELSKVEDDITFVSRKLSNEGFVAKAPEAVVAKEREKLAAYEEAKQTLEVSLKDLEKLA